MTHAILQMYESKPHHLLFKCTGCGEIHGIFVDKTTYETGFTPVWAFEYGEKKGDKQILKIHPSFDSSKVCGYHGPYNWEVEAIVFPEGEKRSPEAVAWLKQ